MHSQFALLRFLSFEFELNVFLCQGGSFPFAWKSAVKRSLHRATTGRICRLDRLAFAY